MNRWEVVKKAWALARKRFPDVERVFVDTPRKFKGSGSCRVYDLSKPEAPIGSMSYAVMHANGSAHVSLSLDGESLAVGMPRKAGAEFKVDSIRVAMPNLVSIDGRVVAARYPDESELCEKIALLAEGHVADQRELRSWMAHYEFPTALMPKVASKMGLPRGGWFNVRVADNDKHPKAKFDKFEKVRVDDEDSMEHMECGQVLDIRGKFKDGYNYLVLVDGSSKPVWIPESSLRAVVATGGADGVQ